MGKSFSKKRLAFLVIGIALLLLCFVLPVSDTFTREAWFAVMGLISSIVLYSGGVVPSYIAMLYLGFVWMQFAKVSVGVVFSAASGANFWLILAAMLLGISLVNCGLATRIALFFMARLPANFKGQALALYIVGTIFHPFIPSQVSKGAMLPSVAREIGMQLGYEPRSREMTGMFMGYFNGFSTFAPWCLTGSVVGASVISFVPNPEYFSFVRWLLIVLPWTLICLIVSYITLQKGFCPKEDTAITKEKIQEMYHKLGPASITEKVVGVTLVICLLCWMFSDIPSVNIAILGTVVCSLAGALTLQDLKKADWVLMILFTLMCGIPGVMEATGVLPWISTNVTPVIAPFISGVSVWIFIPILCVFCYIMRFAITASTAFVPSLMAVLLPLCEPAGLHPFVVGFTIYASYGVYFLEYQSNAFLIVKAAFGSDYIGPHKWVVPQSAAFAVYNIIGLLACVPIWKACGLIY